MSASASISVSVSVSVSTSVSVSVSVSVPVSISVSVLVSVYHYQYQYPYQYQYQYRIIVSICISIILNLLASCLHGATALRRCRVSSFVVWCNPVPRSGPKTWTIFGASQLVLFKQNTIRRIKIRPFFCFAFWVPCVQLLWSLLVMFIAVTSVSSSSISVTVLLFL